MRMEIVNIVGTGSVDSDLDIPALAQDLNAAEVRYDPDNYHGMYVRVKENGPLATLFRTGKYNITGTNSKEMLRRARTDLLSLLCEMGVVERPVDDTFQIMNVVCTGDLGYEVDLSQLAVGLGLEDVEYEPEQFPGLVYRSPEVDCVVLTFSTGKVVVTGSPSLSKLEEAFEILSARIESVIDT
jgi:transcription initiation factor TFIID TATA-box-binding protein